MGELYEYLRVQKKLEILRGIRDNVSATEERDAVKINNDFLNLERWFIGHIKKLEDNAK